MNEPEPKFGDLKFPTKEISSSCCMEGAGQCLSDGLLRFANIRLESHFASFFFATIFFKSSNVFVTGSRRPQLNLPFHVIFGRHASDLREVVVTDGQGACSSIICVFCSTHPHPLFLARKDTCAGRAISPSHQSKQASRLRSSPEYVYVAGAFAYIMAVVTLSESPKTEGDLSQVVQGRVAKGLPNRITEAQSRLELKRIMVQTSSLKRHAISDVNFE